MKSLPDGSYHYYPTETSTRPIVVEMCCGYIAECGEPEWRTLAQYPGRFYRLVEVRDAEPTATIESKELLR